MVKEQLRQLFKNKDEEKRIHEFYSDIRKFAGLVELDSESLIKELGEALHSKTSEEFVELSFERLKKLFDQKIEHPEIFEKIRREAMGNIRLSELMYYTIDRRNWTALIHIGPKGDLSLGEILKAFRDGLHELAKQVEEDERIKEIRATSWIVASNPGLLEKAGFTVEGPVDEKTKIEDFRDETRPISSAHMSRERLLEKWLIT